jgi:hypothetical protein
MRLGASSLKSQKPMRQGASYVAFCVFYILRILIEGYFWLGTLSCQSSHNKKTAAFQAAVF